MTAAGTATGIAEAVRDAHKHIDAGELPQALSVLRPALATVRLDPERPDPDIADAARLYAAVQTSLHESYSALLFSGYAQRAAQLLDKPTSLRALQAGLVHAFVLRATGQLDGAVALQRDVVTRLVERFGPGGRPALAGWADLAVTLHAAGLCEEATKLLHRTYVSHRETFGTEDPQGIKILTRLGVMIRDCGGFERAHQCFDEAKALCARHLTPTDPLTRKVTATARANSDPHHTCGEPASAQPGLDVADLFVSAFDLEVRDLVVSALDLKADDPLVSAVELVASGAPVSLVTDPDLSTRDAGLWFPSVLGHIGGQLTVEGGSSHPFTIDATVSNRVGLAYVQIRIYRPGADPDELPA